MPPSPSMLTWLNRETYNFPPLERALREPNGLLAAGGDLSAERLLAAYRHGCFPGSKRGSRHSGGHPTHAPSYPPTKSTYHAAWRKSFARAGSR